MTQSAFYPPAPTWSSKWCKPGEHWAETKEGGETRKWRGKNTCPDCAAEYFRQYSLANKERIKARDKVRIPAYLASHPDKAQEWKESAKARYDAKRAERLAYIASQRGPRPSDTHKWCTACEQWIDQAADKRRWNHNQCPDCVQAYHKKYLKRTGYRAANADRINARQRYRRSGTDTLHSIHKWVVSLANKALRTHTKACRAHRRQWRKDNPDAVKAERNAQARKWYHANLEHNRKRARDNWRAQYAANPEKGRAQGRRSRRVRRARKHNAVCGHGPGCFDKIAATLPRRCAWCGTTRGKFQDDHIIPLAKGGLDCKFNCQILCVKCHAPKYTNLPDGSKPTIGRLL